jgi:hypothetical protein
MRPIKPSDGIEELEFFFNAIVIEQLQKMVSSFKENDWTEWSFRQDVSLIHASTHTIRLRWLDVFSSTYQLEDSIDFPVLKNLYPYLESFFLYVEKKYEGKVCRAILTKQNPYSVIPVHLDRDFTFTHTHRIHVPIFTNETTFFKCGTKTVNMKVGKTYEINNQLEHSVVNNGSDYKIHLIVDVIENRHIGFDPIPDNVLFIHIPKTAGTSITQALDLLGRNKWVKNPQLRNHDPYFELQKNNVIPKDTFIFSVVRNPFTRAYSYYNHFKAINNVNISFKQFLLIVRNQEIVSEKTPLIRYNQSFYVYDDSGLLATQKLYKFENLIELDFDLNIKLNIENSGLYSLDDYYRDYGNEEQNLVRNLYATDFLNFNYSLDFN